MHQSEGRENDGLGGGGRTWESAVAAYPKYVAFEGAHQPKLPPMAVCWPALAIATLDLGD